MITTALTGSPLSAPGFSWTASGSYSASGAIADSGWVSAQFALSLHPPRSTQIESRRTLTSATGTLELECAETSLPASPSLTRGACAVLSDSGIYAGLTGKGTLTGEIVPGPDQRHNDAHRHGRVLSPGEAEPQPLGMLASPALAKSA